MKTEVIKTAFFDVEIKTPKKTLLKKKNISYNEAISECERILLENKDDEKLCEILNDCIRNFGFQGTYNDGYDVHISAYNKTINTKEKQTCRSRLEQRGDVEENHNLDTWQLRGKDKCCSYCGSLHPDRVLELVKEHGFGIVDPSTKDYKWYINQPNVPNAGFGGIKYYRWHDTKEFIDQYNELVSLAKAKKNNEQV